MKPPKILCHPDSEKSCGACCGMYNRRDNSHAATLERLSRRTRAFFDEARVDDEQSLRAFRAKWEETRAEEKLLSGLPNCPFLGLLGLQERPDDPPESFKVGCLVHPLQNDGLDGRDCGVYDRETCDDYLCATHNLLGAREKLLVLQAVSDSYLYGLVITDVRFVWELFALAADENGMDPPARCLQRPEAIEAAADYFELKRDWPYADDDGIFGQVQPGEGLETSRRKGPSAELGVEPDRYEAVLTCLGTSVDSQEALLEARSLVRARVEAFARAVDL
ncbi:hypothetical protein FIV42_03530 [Persicimonas caeni]|uniref:Uncharacterized protein n=1 Tax=Persicimonas caeni TaxID=2292766 RepID=A0A4Y6PNH4_PERCE|nr:hypothetical protein [Persicimonas caeni]QDG49842.1 hypothetical protein FIV42_03530 [Persicimonas caeni]QED31063.1 hypothetical protein FRD00_03525 [Persicimonas caeni]